MYIIGIDASTTNTGVAVFDRKKGSGDLIYVKHRLISAPKANYHKKTKETKKDYKDSKHIQMADRVDFMINGIYETLGEYKGDAIIIIEDIYARTDINTVKMLGRIQGAVLGYALEHDMCVCFRAPNEWRKIVGIPIAEGTRKYKREELKRLSKEYVKDLFEIDVTDDEADSICIALSFEEDY